MAEPASTSPPAAGVAERDVLLATKLHLPRPRPGFLSRQRLLERLAEGAARELTLVCAPAGFGKTSLLGDWARRGQPAVVWVSLDAGDNDPVRFWRYVAAALDPAGEGVAERVAPVLQTGQPASLEAVVTVVVNALADLPDQVALVLDDYHLIETPPVHHSLGLLLERLPAQLRLVVAGRADPPLPLASLRARGQLAELRQGDLRFTAEETAVLLEKVMGLELPAGSLAALAARTEGWAAGLQLAGLSLRDHADPAGFVASFSGSQRYILDYLTEEVLARQPDEIVQFLLETSVLERLSGALCDAVTGRRDSQQLLEQVERANLFLIPLDEVRGWWRYHHLFADLLRARLLQLQPELVPELHRRAAGWCEQHGLIDEAIRHAAAAGDTPWATRLVEQHLGETLRRGETAMLQRRLSLLSDDAVRSRPGLCLAQALIEVNLGHMESAERLLEQAERTLDHGPNQQHFDLPTHGGMVAEAPAAIALLRAELAGARGDTQAMARSAKAALAHLTEEEHGPRFFARLLVAGADWMAGRMADAESALAAMVAERGTTSVWYPAMPLGQVQQAQGKLGAALRTYREGFRLATERGRFSEYHAGEAHLGIAQVLYARNQLDEALRHVTQAVELGRQVEVQLLAFGLITLSRIRQALGDAEAALKAIDEACHLLPATEVANMFGLARLAQAERARLLLAQGDLAAAARWTDERGLGPDDQPSWPREPEYLVLARVLLASHRPDQAAGLLERWHALAASQGRIGSVIELQALQALAQAARGDHRAALAALAEALHLGATEGYLRVFVDEGQPMATLVGKLLAGRRQEQPTVADGVPPAYLTRVVAAFERAGLALRPPARRGAVVVAGLLEPLSARELEVLGLLAAGHTNQEIAQELVVTLETVKSHVGHILDKLGVANRTQAVARARELGLL